MRSLTHSLPCCAVQVTALTPASVSFARWSYPGVQGEGVVITTEWPAGRFNGSAPLASVDAALQGLRALQQGGRRCMQPAWHSVHQAHNSFLRT